MAAGSAAERAEAKGRASARKRGREVSLPVSHLVLSFTLSFLLPSQFVSCACSHVFWPLHHVCLLLHTQSAPNKSSVARTLDHVGS